jgi:hypothetical protein
MNKTSKIILIIFGILIIALGGLIMFGMYSLEIEDTYGDNQDIFYNSRQGDLVVNHTTNEFGVIRKTWTRFYVVRQIDTVDIYEWWDDKNIEIYRQTDKNVLPDNLIYEDIERLTDEKEIELIQKLR